MRARLSLTMNPNVLPKRVVRLDEKQPLSDWVTHAGHQRASLQVLHRDNKMVQTTPG
jgi:hypothetical protein